MYGFGDVQDPLPETITVMEDLLIDYITNLVAPPSLSYHPYNDS